MTTKQIAEQEFGTTRHRVKRNRAHNSHKAVRALNTVLDLDGGEYYRPVIVYDAKTKTTTIKKYNP